MKEDTKKLLKSIAEKDDKAAKRLLRKILKEKVVERMKQEQEA